MIREWCLVSGNGVSDVGGVERVMRYLRDLLVESHQVRILDREELFRRWPWARALCGGRIGRELVCPVLFSVHLWMHFRHAKVVSNGFTACAYPSDIVVFHGTMQGFARAVRGVVPRRIGVVWWVLILYERLAAALAKHIVAVSDTVRDEVITGYRPRAAVTVIPNAVDTGHFTILPRVPGDAGVVRVLFVGRVEPRKGTDVLQTLAGVPGCTLTVVTPPCRGVGLFRNLPGVQVRVGVGYRDMPSVYQGADVMIVPSYYEGFEMVTLEALACGVPVVGRCVGGVRVLMREGCPGVFEMNQGAGWVDQLRAVASEFDDFERRRALREFVAVRYGVESFKRRWQELGA